MGSNLLDRVEVAIHPKIKIDQSQSLKLTMAGVNVDAAKSLDFIIKVVVWVFLLIAMAILEAKAVVYFGTTIHAGQLASLGSLGFFFIYSIQILTILLGEKVPFTMGVMTAALGAIFNFCICVIVLHATAGICNATDCNGPTAASNAYGSFCLFVTVGLVADALLTLKNKNSAS